MRRNQTTLEWPRDSTRVNVVDEHELRFWAARFHVGREMLKRAVIAVGPRFRDVVNHLNYKRGVSVG